MRKDRAGEGVAGIPARRCIDENRFIAARRADGDIDLASRHIRNSISLTMRHARRMICASHQSGGGSAGRKMFSQRSSLRNVRSAERCANGGAVPTQERG